VNQRTKPLFLTFQDGLCKIHEFFNGLYITLLVLFNRTYLKNNPRAHGSVAKRLKMPTYYVYASLFRRFAPRPEPFIFEIDSIYCMKMNLKSNIIELPELRDQTHVFQDRTHAGEVLTRMLAADDKQDGIIMAIPAGGVPVGVVMAEKTGLDFDVSVVSKITLPWNTEAGYGAVAFDGTVQLNKDLIGRVNLTDEDVEKGIEKTTDKVERRVTRLRGKKPFPDLKNRSAILVDDGLASGFTIRTAAAALRNAGAGRIVVAVPTGHLQSVEIIARKVEALHCANIRGGYSYAVAGAYRNWSDVEEDDVVKMLEQLKLLYPQ
jgi:putative phosphoribosyl transferase